MSSLAATITSGGDTSLRGATVAANTIRANVGGSLSIESLRDSSTYSSTQSSTGGSVSVGGGGGFGASLNSSRANINSNFQSVGEQSGLQAGNGGFQVNVANNTTLTGGVIASTNQAVSSGNNRFTTGGSLNVTDVQNTASFSGTAVGISAGFSGGKLSGSAGVGIADLT